MSKSLQSNSARAKTRDAAQAELQALRATAERLRSDPEAARRLAVQAGIYTEKGNLRTAFGG